jgi:hypothetical protein
MLLAERLDRHHKRDVCYNRETCSGCMILDS